MVRWVKWKHEYLPDFLFRDVPATDNVRRESFFVVYLGRVQVLVDRDPPRPDEEVVFKDSVDRRLLLSSRFGVVEFIEEAQQKSLAATGKCLVAVGDQRTKPGLRPITLTISSLSGRRCSSVLGKSWGKGFTSVGTIESRPF